MDIFGSQSTPGCVLNEQIARQVYQVLPEQGPIMVIMDRKGNCWPSDSDRFAAVNIGEVYLRELCAKIDDGDEPIVAHHDGYGVIAASLATERTDCGFVIIILPQHSPEATLADGDMIELVFNQLGLIARLIEKNNLLYERQVRQGASHGQSSVVAN
jgi:hypothetical protein